MAQRPITLGPWELSEPFSHGGFGDVWRGVHRFQGGAFAVKVMREKRMREAGAVAMFRREVQLVAGLDHPGIVMVLDYGEVTAEAARASGGKLSDGSPYLVMELAQGGALSDILPQRNLEWDEIRELLLSLLDALAHAHAREVIHRDIKPGNVLDFGESGWRLTDFGIAHVLDQSREGLRERSRGTPYYMAPEQLLGLFRDYGPWTDLYALGCLTYRLVNGAPPFSGRSVEEMARLHLRASLPPLRPLVRVPGGLRVWLQRLMAKKPGQRFARAADAARALAELGSLPVARPSSASRFEPVTLDFSLSAGVLDGTTSPREVSGLLLESARLGVEGAGSTTIPRLVSLRPMNLPTLSATLPDLYGMGEAEVVTMELDLELGESLEEAEPRAVFDDGPTLRSAELPAELRGRSAVAHAPSRHGVPASWRGEDPRPRPVALMGAGLELFGLRAIPMVGRELERDALWGELRTVWRQGQARACLVSGAAGSGKSRLAEWIARRAHEVGSANVLWATHGPEGGPTHGLGRMLARYFQCGGLSPADVEKRIGRWLSRVGVSDPLEARALMEVIGAGTSLDASATIQFVAPAQRHAVVRRALGHIARERPVVVWLDDVQWGLDALEFLVGTLEGQGRDRLPILFLLTAQDEALAEHLEATRAVTRLLQRDTVAHVHLEALDGASSRALVGRLLSFEPRVAEELAERCAGNPMFAIQVVGDWIERGLLHVRDGVFTLQARAGAALPDTLHAVWAEHAERVLAGRGEDDRRALEVAAMLGQEVVGQEWAMACEELGVAPSEELVGVLVGRRLARWTEDGWAFVHGMLRESLLRILTEAGRQRRLASACGRVFARLYETTGARRLAERAGRFLVTAGEHARAVELLYVGAVELRNGGDFREATALLLRRERAYDAMGAGPSAERWRGLLLMAELRKLQGRHDDAVALCEQVQRDARQFGWSELEAESLLERGDIAYRRGMFEQAIAYVQGSLAMARARADASGIARACSLLGRVALRTGELDDAIELLSLSAERFEALSELVPFATATMALGTAHLHRGDLERAEVLFVRAWQLYEGQGIVHSAAAAVNAMGELSRARGDLDAAERHYRQVIQIYEAMGAVDVDIPRNNVGLIHLQRGEYAEARAILEGVRAALERSGQVGNVGGLYIELLPCVAAVRDWTTWDLYLDRGQALLAESGSADADDAWPAQLAGELAAAVGEVDRARVAFLVARMLWEKLGNMEKLLQVEEALARLGGEVM